MTVTDFLNDLRKRYGDIPTESFRSRLVKKAMQRTSNKCSAPIKTASENFSYKTAPQSSSTVFDVTPKNIHEDTSPKLFDDAKPSAQSSLDSIAQYGINVKTSTVNKPMTTINKPVTVADKPLSPLISRRYPISKPAPPKHKFLPVNISGSKDWWELRMIVLDLHEFKNFFAGKQDSQSPQFLNLINTYANEVEKNLAQPAEFDENASMTFVKKLAEVIEKRFYTILKAYKPGLEGKGKMPRSYYQSLDSLVKNYFKNIGLEPANVRVRSSFRDWREHMKATAVLDAPFEHMDNMIFEVAVQPHYFRCINEDLEEEKFWIDGECSVYKKKVMR